MIFIDDLDAKGSLRKSVDILEPFAIEKIKKDKHHFFVYRCSDYQNFDHLCVFKGFDLKSIDNNLINIINSYWSAIDVIKIVPEGMPKYYKSKKYFDDIREIEIKNKSIKFLGFYEIKFGYGISKSTLSVRTYEFMNEILKFGFKLNFMYIKIDGNIHFNRKYVDFSEDKFEVKTHYGRENRYVYRKTS